MKNLFLCLVFGLMSLTIYAQKDITSINEINIYGVDFSKAVVFGATETPEDIINGLDGINPLLHAEASKYNFGKYLKKNVVAYYTQTAQKNNEEIDPDKLFSNKRENELSQQDIQSLVNKLESKSRDKTGVLFIAEVLDKPNKKATYTVVFFDEETQEIIYSKQVTGRAQGFGIRNYWARSIFEILKRWKY